MPPRTLSPGQSCQIRVHDSHTGSDRLLLETRELLLEAPNWTLQGDCLVLNGNGHLWKVALDNPHLERISIDGLPPANNDHVLDPDGQHVFISTYGDWQIYRAPLAGGTAIQVTGKEGPTGLLHFLHGVSPDGQQLAFVGVEAKQDGDNLTFLSSEICTIGADGRTFDQITHDAVPADGPEYSPDGQWIYLNTEAFTGHAQIARMRPDGSDLARLSFSETVDWFPHLSPDGKTSVYLAYPPGTRGHPADLCVGLMLVNGEDWQNARQAVRLFGGQGTINVNSWSPDSRHFAYAAYPMDQN